MDLFVSWMLSSMLAFNLQCSHVGVSSNSAFDFSLQYTYTRSCSLVFSPHIHTSSFRSHMPLDNKRHL